MLVESTHATWLTGTGFEHNTIYNYNLHRAANVYAGLQQAETPYWQGPGSKQNAPAPRTPIDIYRDPTFSWCSSSDQKCRMALAQNIYGGEQLFLYGAAFWTFFNNYQSCDNCVTNQARVQHSPAGLYWYSVNTKSASVMIMDGKDNPTQSNHPGNYDTRKS
jgi:hypothetical protein